MFTIIVKAAVEVLFGTSLMWLCGLVWMLHLQSKNSKTLTGGGMEVLIILVCLDVIMLMDILHAMPSAVSDWFMIINRMLGILGFLWGMYYASPRKNFHSPPTAAGSTAQ